MTELTLHKLSKDYEPGVTAVKELDLTVNNGELMVLLGPSGCGKTTTLRMVAGLIRPTSGDVLFDEVSVLDLPPEARGAVMVFQEHALFPFMSVGDNVAYGLKMRGLPRAKIGQQVAEALRSVQLDGYEDRWPEQLSGGQKQRVALARALVVRPKFLLLDEPLSNLDRGLREELRLMVRSLQKAAGISTLFVTHDQAEAVAIADRIAVMMNGKIRQVGQPDDFYERPADLDVARFFGAENFVPAVKRGWKVTTDFGELEVTQSSLADGPVMLTVRPEAIELGPNGHNNFVGNVQKCQNRVPAQGCQVSINGTILKIIPPAYHKLHNNDEVVVHLPRERLMLLPVE